MDKKTRTINPILYWFETIFVDWWLLRLFAIIYTPTPKKLGQESRKRFESDLIPFLQDKKRYIPAGDKEYVNKDAFEEALMHAESQAVISSPLSMVGVFMLIIFVISPWLNIDSTELGAVFKSALIIFSLIGIRAYIRVRYHVYKMRRIVTNAD